MFTHIYIFIHTCTCIHTYDENTPDDMILINNLKQSIDYL